MQSRQCFLEVREMRWDDDICCDSGRDVGLSSLPLGVGIAACASWLVGFSNSAKKAHSRKAMAELTFGVKCVWTSSSTRVNSRNDNIMKKPARTRGMRDDCNCNCSSNAHNHYGEDGTATNTNVHNSSHCGEAHPRVIINKLFTGSHRACWILLLLAFQLFSPLRQGDRTLCHVTSRTKRTHQPTRTELSPMHRIMT